MKIIGVREFKNGVSEVLRQVQAGERFIITNQGRPVAELLPARPQPWNTWDQVADLFTGPDDPALFDDLAELGSPRLASPWGETK